jgi:hypothetical protein
MQTDVALCHSIFFLIAEMFDIWHLKVNLDFPS